MVLKFKDLEKYTKNLNVAKDFESKNIRGRGKERVETQLPVPFKLY